MFYKSCFYLATSLVVLIFACSPSEEYPDTYKGERLHFGQGGGITGNLNYYVLLDNGQLFQRAPRDSTFTLAGTWDDAFVTQMFANYKTLHLDTVDFYQPGDLYYFIQFQSGDEPLHRIAWGRPGYIPDNNIVTYYNLLYKSTKSKS